MIFLKGHLVVVAATCIVAPSLSAQTTMTTDPVGFTTTSLLGNSDTYVGVPFTRPPEFTGMAQSADENTVTINGTPGWTNNQFVYSAGTQPKHYYVLIWVMGGAVNPNEGHIYHITGNGSNTLSVDTTFESLRGIVARYRSHGYSVLDSGDYLSGDRCGCVVYSNDIVSVLSNTAACS